MINKINHHNHDGHAFVSCGYASASAAFFFLFTWPFSAAFKKYYKGFRPIGMAGCVDWRCGELILGPHCTRCSLTVLRPLKVTFNLRRLGKGCGCWRRLTRIQINVFLWPTRKYVSQIHPQTIWRFLKKHTLPVCFFSTPPTFERTSARFLKTKISFWM